jgi:GT2 family glycosyltransferase
MSRARAGPDLVNEAIASTRECDGGAEGKRYEGMQHPIAGQADVGTHRLNADVSESLVEKSGRSASADAQLAVVIATRNRRASLLRTLANLDALRERPSIVVVDNGSADGTPAAVRAAFPQAKMIPLGQNVGPFARTIGVRAADRPYVAFSDDDSWWAAGALARAAELLDQYPTLAVVAAHVLVGQAEHDDETTLAMGASPLGRLPHLPGPRVLGFLACGSVVRRKAFLEVGGFCERLMGFEETLLAVDLAGAGWELAYVADVVAHHHPSPQRDSDERRRSHVRNALRFTWLRRPASIVVLRTANVLVDALGDKAVRAAVADVIRDYRSLARGRRVVHADVEAALRRLHI